jgi:alanine racemase
LQLIVDIRAEVKDLPEANIIFVKDALQALQSLAKHHRKHFNIPVIGITGSNGKTIVKEWLNQLLGEKFNIVRSPKSYNSQIGVPLSIWQTTSRTVSGFLKPVSPKRMKWTCWKG